MEQQLFQIIVDKVIEHESYKRSPWQTSNDIALLRLDTPVELAPNVIPVCLPIKADQVQVRDLANGNTGNLTSVFGQSDLAYLWEVPNLQEGIKDMQKYVTVAGYGRTSSDKYDLGELHTVGKHMTLARHVQCLLLCKRLSGSLTDGIHPTYWK